MPLDTQRNADRFRGFADTYDTARPRLPAEPAAVIGRYLGHMPDTVIDLGCGTGLSTLVWDGRCRQVIGVEPSEDMLAIARQKTRPGLSFVRAFAHQTGLPDGCADAVVCSQSFHWMEPTSTLREVNRLLREGGVFATVDCDWPPVCDWRVELAYTRLIDRVHRLEETEPALRSRFVRFPKSKHLQNIRDSGYFRYVRELVFSHEEACTADRLRALAYSQGGLQGVLRWNPAAIAEPLAAYEQAVADCCPEGSFPITFCYRMRIGIR